MEACPSEPPTGAMAAAAASPGATLLPEPPMPDIDSPRVHAAMSVLGILPQELEKRELADYDGIEPRYELFETKRRMLIGQIGHMTSRSPDTTQLVSNEEASRSGNAAFMEKVLQAERRNFERMAWRAKKDTQKIVIEELETKLSIHNANKKMEESTTRLKALKKARNDQLKQLQKEAQKKADKNAEVRNRAEKRMEEEASELITKLEEANQKAATKMAAIAESHEELRVKGQERQVQITDKLARLEQQQLRHRQHKYDAIVAKDEAKMERLAEIVAMRQSQSEAIMQKQQDSMERVRTHWENKQKQTEDRYSEILKRHEIAKQKREELHAARLKDYSSKNKKERNAFEGRYERILKDLDEHPNVSRRLQQSSGSEPFERSLSDTQIAALSMRSHHVDLVAMNRERLRRAHHHAQEKQLNKIDMMRQRVEFMLHSKSQADKRRTMTLKNCAIEKHRLSDEVDKVKSAGAEKMMGLLEDIDPEPKAATRIREIMGHLGLEKLYGGGEEAEK